MVVPSHTIELSPFTEHSANQVTRSNKTTRIQPRCPCATAHPRTPIPAYFSFSAASSAARFLRSPSRLAFMRSTRSLAYTFCFCTHLGCVRTLRRTNSHMQARQRRTHCNRLCMLACGPHITLTQALKSTTNTSLHQGNSLSRLYMTEVARCLQECHHTLHFPFGCKETGVTKTAVSSVRMYTNKAQNTKIRDLVLPPGIQMEETLPAHMATRIQVPHADQL